MTMKPCVAFTAKLVAVVDEFRASTQRTIACHEQQCRLTIFHNRRESDTL